ncbi:MAG: DUF4118 domain-containing protein [Acidimicrobiales bacterium]
MNDERAERLFWVAIGGLAPIAVASALVSLRDVMLNANVALVLVLVVVAVASAGGREAGAAAALSSALSFDFFHTLPYLRLTIATGDDVETTLLLLAVGLVVGHLAARARRARRSAKATSGEVGRIVRVAAAAANGEDPADVILAAQTELTELLRLRECRFEAPPFGDALPQIERSGVVLGREHRLRHEGFELPAGGSALPVFGRGQMLGRFVLEPTPGTGVSHEERVVAVAIADQVGAVLAAPTGTKGAARG